MSIDYDEKDNLIQVIGVSVIGLPGEKNRRTQAIPEFCSQSGFATWRHHRDCQQKSKPRGDPARAPEIDLGTVTVESDRSDVQTAIEVQKFGSVTI